MGAAIIDLLCALREEMGTTLVIATHGEPGDLFAVGSTASAGVESMAEVGTTATLVGELRADNTVDVVMTGRRIDGPGTDQVEVVATRMTGLVSLVSMPSRSFSCARSSGCFS